MTIMVAIFHRGPLNNGKEIHCSECGRVFENWDDFDEHIKICKLETVLGVGGSVAITSPPSPSRSSSQHGGKLKGEMTMSWKRMYEQINESRDISVELEKNIGVAFQYMNNLREKYRSDSEVLCLYDLLTIIFQQIEELRRILKC